MNKILEVKNISKNYHTLNGEIEAIKDISFDLYEGETLGIVGSSGCGKSTLLNILAGLDNTYKGFINSHNLKVAYMLQSDALLPYLSVLDNALIGLKLKKELNEDNILYVKKLINLFGLDDFINEKPNNLSGGMKQRVALIRTLALKPDILLLDEPLSRLDYVTRLTITDEIYKILKELNISSIIISHDIAECVSFCDEVLVLSKRPSVIKNKYRIDLSNKTIPSENRKDPNFNKYYDLIWSILDK